MGCSRPQFYEIRRQYQTLGAVGLMDRLPGGRGPHPNRVSEEIETAVLEHCMAHPPRAACGWGPGTGPEGDPGQLQRCARRMGRRLLSKHDRLLRMEASVYDKKLDLNEEQARLLERFSPEFRERHIEVKASGELVAVNTVFVLR